MNDSNSNLEVIDMCPLFEENIQHEFTFELVTTVTVLYVILFVTGISGNVITCYVIATRPSMHTPTNHYLFSLAVSDMMILLVIIPNDLYFMWLKSGLIDIIFLYAFIAETASNVSMLTVTVLTIERYLAILFPLNNHTMSNLCVVNKCIVGIWLISILVSGVLSVFIFLWTRFLIDHSVYEYFTGIYFFLSSLLFFVVPITIMATLYTSLVIYLKDHSNYIRSISTSNFDEGIIIKMLVGVFIVFVICYTPFQIQRLLQVYVVCYPYQFSIVYTISGIMYISSATLNPILYNFLSEKFRQEFKIILFRTC